MKVIFLDIDGVLNYWGSEVLDKTCVANLKYLVSMTGAKIVLISTWKYFLDDSVLEELNENSKEREDFLHYRELFYSVFKDDLTILDIGPDLELKRSEEVRQWLEKHIDLGIKSFVIIDDFNCEYDINYPNNWVRTYLYDKGLTKEKVQKAIEILNNN